MGRSLNKLSAVGVQKAKKPGYYGDGGGLWLQVSSNGGKSWVFRYTVNGKSREMGLGPFHSISLTEARESVGRWRKVLLEGRDPIEERKSQKAAERLIAAKSITFQDCAEQYIEANKAGWKNAKHASQWQSSLKTYAYPVLGRLSVADIDTSLVMKVIEGIWRTKTETASRVRQRIEVIIDWATVRGFREGANPARLKGHLDKLLPARSKVAKVKAHPALPYQQLPHFMADLTKRDGVAARALAFLILTATRSGEVRGAQWSEIDLKSKLWVIPPERMKAEKEQRIPLSDAAIQILMQLKTDTSSELVFPSRSKNTLSDVTISKVIKRLHDATTKANANKTESKGYVDPHQSNRVITVHGFRSTFGFYPNSTDGFKTLANFISR